MSQFEVRTKVNEFVELAALGPVSGFYPSAVAKYANTSVSLVFKFLFDLTKTGELSLKWELRCPNLEFSCLKTIEVSDEKRFGDEIECPKCGYEFEVHQSDFFPRFEINEDYKDYIRERYSVEERKKKVQLLNLA